MAVMSNFVIQHQAMVFIVILIVAIIQLGTAEGDSTLCAYYDAKPLSQGGGAPDSSHYWGDDVQEDNRTIRCHANNYCFTLWSSHPVNGSKARAVVLKQGCWIGDSLACQNGMCEAVMAPKNHSHFCCCSGDMCNQNFTDGYNPAAHTTVPTFASPYRHNSSHEYKMRTVVISLVSVFSVALVIIVGYLGYRMCLRPRHLSLESLHVAELPPVKTEMNMDDLKLCCMISRGRYAEVWKGKLDSEDVAVKIYSSHHRQYYNNELTLYRFPFMDSDTLVKFYGAEERLNQEGSAQLMIVMAYMPLGSLHGYLKNNALDWPTMVRMGYTVTRALAHLHTDIRKGDRFKPVLAHRDINTRNILVNNDLTCILADLGFAVATIGPKLIKKGHAEMAEQTSLTDVGTLRYMAPELLDGAVNLRDCEASLKQIDIYALGLVLWEIATRCVDLYQGAPLPEYAPPFQAEVGSSPTFEDMQMTVVRNKKRPRFPEVWKESNSAIRSLRETIEECWDADAEARLTALCVEERLSELSHLWAQEIKHRGMTPTLNAMMNVNDTAVTTTTSTTTADPSDELATTILADDITMPLLGVTPEPARSEVEFSSSSAMSSVRTSWRDSISAGEVTGETLVAITPVDGLPLPPKASNVTQAVNSAALRPHTGRNPTVERNTHKRSNEELTLSGNMLVSAHFSEDVANHRLLRRDSSTRSAPPPNHQAPTAASLVESPADYMNDGPETSSLVQNDALSHRTPPIPFLQNQVHGHHPVGPPKVANTALRAYSKGDRSLKEKLSRLIRPKDIGHRLSGLNIFSSGRSRHDYSRADDLEVEDVPGEGVEAAGVRGHENGAVSLAGVVVNHRLPRPPSNLEQAQAQAQQRLSQGSAQPVHTEVRLQNGSVVTRPTNLDVAAHYQAAVSDHQPASWSSTAELPPSQPIAPPLNGATSSSYVAPLELADSEASASVSGRNLGQNLVPAVSLPGSKIERVALSGGNQSLRNGISIASQEHAKRYPENRLRFAEVGVAKLHMPLPQKQPVLHFQGQGHSKSTSELLRLGQALKAPDSCWQETELSGSREAAAASQRRRPNSLSLKGHNYSMHAFVHPRSAKKAVQVAASTSEAWKPSGHRAHNKHHTAVSAAGVDGREAESAEVAADSQLPTTSVAPLTTHKRSTSVEGMSEHPRQSFTARLLVPDEASEKIRRRVKTPIRPAKHTLARLSLYDDRLMSGCPNVAGAKDACQRVSENFYQGSERLLGKDLRLKSKVAIYNNNNDKAGVDLNIFFSDSDSAISGMAFGDCDIRV